MPKADRRIRNSHAVDMSGFFSERDCSACSVEPEHKPHRGEDEGLAGCMQVRAPFHVRQRNYWFLPEMRALAMTCADVQSCLRDIALNISAEIPKEDETEF